MTILWVALGGAAGAPLRYLLGQRLDPRRPGWHLGTLAANTGASLLLGACVGWSLGGTALALVGTGFCGGLSTYSSLAVQTRDLGPRRGPAYAGLTIVTGLAACSLGFLLAAG
ncbi:fluoride efflux transporter FluC [Nocardioides caeni]|uniref:Fluoride-specific ion channel FluC n=1 Tax=Nocardioides caeni TaxID=574700 RepID=A0A4S8MZX7_9ACTN|nr:CrcB family protein [Nocardioides caeni]THV08915.1 CrcB family protein [Nocardioides caeni]